MCHLQGQNPLPREILAGARPRLLLTVLLLFLWLWPCDPTCAPVPPHVHSEVDLSIFKKFPVVFAGDLHSHSNCQENIVYPGSPMSITFHRNKIENGYLIIEDNWEWSNGIFKQVYWPG